MLQDPVVRLISELGPNALQELLPEIPLWVNELGPNALQELLRHDIVISVIPYGCVCALVGRFFNGVSFLCIGNL